MTKIKLNNLEISQEDLIKELENNPEIMGKLKEKFGKKESGWFVPKGNDEYFYLDEDGIDNMSNYFDTKRAKYQKLYRTRKEAQQASLRQQAKIRILKTIAEENAKVGWVCDWSDYEQEKCYLEHNYTKGFNFNFGNHHQHQETDFYFSYEVAHIVLEKCAEDYKIYLGVK